MESKPGLPKRPITRFDVYALRRAAEGMHFSPGWFSPLRSTGISGDYFNNLVGILHATRAIADPTATSENLAINGKRLQSQLASAKTYTGYWEEEAEIVNANAVEDGRPLVDPSAVISFFVQDIPSAPRLDVIALELRALVKGEPSPESLIEPVVYRIVEARRIIFGEEGKEREDTLLAEFGLTRKEPQE